MEMGFKWSRRGLSSVLILMLCVDLMCVVGRLQEFEFTFVLPAGDTECFFQPTGKNSSIIVEYQVIAGSSLDVGFALISPSGHRLVSDFRKPEGTHMLESTELGDYRFCFDNSFSRLSDKMVYLILTVDPRNDTVGENEDWANLMEPEQILGYKLENIREMIEVVHSNLARSRQVQGVLRAFEARDRHMLEDSLWRVSFWSSISLLVMISVGLTQVFTVRRFFRDDNRGICP